MDDAACEARRNDRFRFAQCKRAQVGCRTACSDLVPSRHPRRADRDACSLKKQERTFRGFRPANQTLAD